jgi:hypothetical protein
MRFMLAALDTYREEHYGAGCDVLAEAPELEPLDDPC